MLSKYTFMSFLNCMGDGQQSRMGTGRKADIYPATSTTVCTSLGTETCPGTQHSRSGCDTAFPAPGWGRTLENHPLVLCFMGRASFSRKAPSGGQSHHQCHGKSSCTWCYSQVTSGGNERSNSTGWKRGASSELQRLAPPPPSQRGLHPETELPEEMIHPNQLPVRGRTP